MPTSRCDDHHKRTYFPLSDNIVEHVAGVDDFEVAEAIYRAAITRWPMERVMLRQGARVVHDTGQRLAH